MSSAEPDQESRPLLRDQETQTPRAPFTPLPKFQLVALCIGRLSDPIASTQILPYINEFLATLHVADPSKVGYYSGLVASTASVAELITVFQWAKFSDIVGRRPILLSGTIGLAATSLLFGLSGSLLQILTLGALTGVFIGNTSVYSAVLAELTDSTNQAIAYSVYGCIYPLGATVGPLIGGTFSNLATKYPDRFRHSFLQSYPYFAPGFICALFILLGLILMYFFLEETLPCKKEPVRVSNDAPTTLLPSPDGTMTIGQLLEVPRIRTLTASTCGLSFLYSGFRVTFVLFAYTPIEMGGLGFSVAEIGYSVSMLSAIFVLLQLLLAPHLLRRFDIGRLYIFCMGLWPLTFILIPVLNVIARLHPLGEPVHNEPTTHKIALWVGIAVVLTCSAMASLSFSAKLILVRSNCPSPASLGAANGLNQFVLALARCVGPTLVSVMFAFSVDAGVLGGHLWVVVMVLTSLFVYHISRGVEHVKDK
ncbi:major facilitator superfamily domain-containing protein [Mycena alexandri]|uniref:Major facilitator superfamily domain-containing protein n=1 Tax=Mycena alexandri TaxID=1745969 RepID=A0AAD6T9J8_9AGAR|nr:major facilitator superfamily domain-containing protein [Mycena alexandri]